MGPIQPITGRPARAVRFTLLGTLVPVAIATATDSASHRGLFFVGAVSASIASVLGRALPRGTMSFLATLAALPALALMQAYTGGIGSPYSVLLIAVAISLGLEAGERQLIAAMMVFAACSFGPMLLVGSPAYPVRWGNAAMIFAIGAAAMSILRTAVRESEALTRRLGQQAMVDDLTGLLNRRGWRQLAPRELTRAARAGTPTALLSLDLDRLKDINDHLGHREGDRVLHETADRMRATLRAGDVIARLGGDEFVALLTDSTLDGTLAAVQRLRAATPEGASFSAGVAIWDEVESLQELIIRSDQALYAAKAAGGGSTAVAAPAGVSAVAS